MLTLRKEVSFSFVLVFQMCMSWVAATVIRGGQISVDFTIAKLHSPLPLSTKKKIT